MSMRMKCLVSAMVVGALAPSTHAWDHPGHMVTAAVAFADIESTRPALIEKLGMLFLRHPDTAPFWVAAGEAKGKERVRRMFIECARWADDSKFTPRDMLTWHSARWAMVANDAPSEVKAAAAARLGKPVGQALEALALNYAMIANAESTPPERAFGLCWVLHIVGDIHQPMHVSDLFSEDFPTGNAAATTSYVRDPITDSAIPLHILWDSNALRVPTLEEVDRHTQAFMKKYPRTSFPELKAAPAGDPSAFTNWAKESHQIAVDWALNLEMLPDPNKDQPSDKLVQNMINFILNGVSPVKDAPPLPAGYWEKLQSTAERQLTLAGYRIADLIFTAADQIEGQSKFVGR